MRTLQEWMGHRDFTTTLIDADFAPDPAEGAAFAERAFGRSMPPSTRLTPIQTVLSAQTMTVKERCIG